MKKLKVRISELEGMLLENPEPTPPPPGSFAFSTGDSGGLAPGSLEKARQIARGQDLPIDLALEVLPEETLYMNRSNGRIQMFYESTDTLWDNEETF